MDRFDKLVLLLSKTGFLGLDVVPLARETSLESGFWSFDTF